MQQETADVLVIGAGAAGAALTKRLTDLGAKVVCLEQGGWVKPSDYPSTRPDWEIQIRRGAFNFSPNVRKRWEDYPVVETGTHPPDVLMFNAVGGSTHHWTGHFPRFHPSDFRARTLDGVAEDWPISYQELEPYYDMNDRRDGRGGNHGRSREPTANETANSTAASGHARRNDRTRLRQAGLVLVAIGQCHHLAGLRQPPGL